MDPSRHHADIGGARPKCSGRRAGRASVLAAALLVLGCANQDGGERSTGNGSTESTPPAPTVTFGPTSTTSAGVGTTVAPAVDELATTTTSSVVVPTTVPLPQPSAPPADPEAAEPVVELGSLSIPALGVESTLYEGIRLPTFDLGPGHWPGTALPGEPGNVVIGGHRTEGNADFRGLDQLQPGDEVVLTTAEGGRFTYLVESAEITDPFAAKVIYQTPEKTATLFACHPPGSVQQRIVVHLAIAA